MELPAEPPRYFSLNAGALDPGDAMLAAKARVQASSAAFSGEAKETEGESAAIDAALRRRIRMIMMVFLLKKYQHPTQTLARGVPLNKREILLAACGLSHVSAARLTRLGIRSKSSA
jgi:hypothetical protein